MNVLSFLRKINHDSLICDKIYIFTQNKTLIISMNIIAELHKQKSQIKKKKKKETEKKLQVNIIMIFS